MAINAECEAHDAVAPSGIVPWYHASSHSPASTGGRTGPLSRAKGLVHPASSHSHAVPNITGARVFLFMRGFVLSLRAWPLLMPSRAVMQLATSWHLSVARSGIVSLCTIPLLLTQFSTRAWRLHQRCSEAHFCGKERTSLRSKAGGAARAHLGQVSAATTGRRTRGAGCCCRSLLYRLFTVSLVV